MNKYKQSIFILLGTIMATFAVIKVVESVSILTQDRTEKHDLVIENVKDVARMTSVVYLDEFVLTCVKYEKAEVLTDTTAKRSFMKPIPSKKSVVADTLCFVTYDNEKGQLKRPKGLGPEWKEVDQYCYIFNSKTRVGFDLSKVSDKDIRVNKDSLAVRLPSPEIFDVTINPKDYKIHHGNPGWADEQYIFRNVKKQCAQRAIEEGVLVNAEEIGFEQLRNLFQTFGFSHILLTIEPESEHGQMANRDR